MKNNMFPFVEKRIFEVRVAFGKALVDKIKSGLEPSKDDLIRVITYEYSSFDVMVLDMNEKIKEMDSGDWNSEYLIF